MTDKERLEQIKVLINEVINNQASSVDGTNELAVRSLNLKYSIKNMTDTVLKLDHPSGCSCGSCK